MASLKPVIHGRDHLPGGADPIPVESLKSVLLGSAEEHFEATPTGCASLDTTGILMSHFSGTVIASASSPDKLVVTKPGVYACTVGVSVIPPGAEPATAAIDLSVRAIQASITWGITPGSLPGVATFLNGDFGTAGSGASDSWTASVCVVSLLDASDYFEIQMFNRNSYAVDLVVRAALVRIIQL